MFTPSFNRNKSCLYVFGSFLLKQCLITSKATCNMLCTTWTRLSRKMQQLDSCQEKPPKEETQNRLRLQRALSCIDRFSEDLFLRNPSWNQNKDLRSLTYNNRTKRLCLFIWSPRKLYGLKNKRHKDALSWWWSDVAARGPILLTCLQRVTWVVLKHLPHSHRSAVLEGDLTKQMVAYGR